MIKNLKNKKKKGFTLIELIIVIAIIAILAAIAIPKFGDVRRNANVKSDVANAKTIANAVTALIAEGDIEAADDTITLNTAADEAATAIGNYLQTVPTPKSVKEDNFTVKIDENGGVTVLADNMKFFPTTDGAPTTISVTNP